MDFDKCGAYAALEVAKVSDQDGAYDVLISTDQLNRNGWQLDYKGWQLDSYRANPVVMFGHDYYAVPVGRSLDIQIDKRAKGLSARFEFRPAANDFDPVHPIRAAWDAGYLKGASVGFIPLEYEPLDENSSEWFGPFRSLRQDLLEWSIVPIPADPATLRKNLAEFTRGRCSLDRAIMSFGSERAVYRGVTVGEPVTLEINTTDEEPPEEVSEDTGLAPAASVTDQDGQEEDLSPAVQNAIGELIGAIRNTYHIP